MESPKQERQKRSRTRTVLYALALWLAFGLTMRLILGALAAEPANEHFQRTWSRTDQPVQVALVDRTWMWGPEAFTDGLMEPYVESPSGERLVQYFDKSRMEDNSYRASGAPWDVTNGLLVVELVTGNLQLGDATFEQHQPAEGNVAGDQDALDSPSYETMTGLLNADPLPDGAPITWRLARSGDVSDDPVLASYGVTAGHRVTVPGIDHQVASPFWSFMNAEGMVYENGTHLSANLFLDPFYATGYPITEAYWANVKVAGTYQDVLLQCFERRCLTYTPGNGEGWQVEAGNVGQHYYTWRYEQVPAEGGDATPPDDGTPPADGTAPEEPSPTETPDDPEASPTATMTPEPPDDDPAPTDPAEEPYSYIRQWGEAVDPDATFDKPNGVATSDDGYVYVTDWSANRVLKFAADGQFVTMWGETGNGNGQFNTPTGIAVDSTGNVYVADHNNRRVQKFNSAGEYLTKWGSPDGLSSDVEGEFASPEGIAIDSSGYVYVTDSDNDRVQKFDSSGGFVRAWGSDGFGEGQFASPTGIAIDGNDTIYVGDYYRCRVQKFDTDGAYLGELDTDSTGGGCSFQYDKGIAVGDTGIVYVVDSGKDRIQAFSSSGNLVGSVGTTGSGALEFNQPMGIAIDEQGGMYITDFDNGRVQKLDIVGNYVDEWTDGRLGRIPAATYGMARDADGNIYLSDSSYDRIQVFDSGGDFLHVFGEPGFGARGLTVTDDGYVYAVDDRVVKYRIDGTFVTEWGAGTLNQASGVAVDSAGNVYVANSGYDTILKYDASGGLRHSWGGNGDGEGEFYRPTDIAIHGDRVYVLDRSNHRVQVFDLNGAFLGEWNGADGAGGELADPLGIGVDPDGDVFVVDSGVNRIQKFTPEGVYLTQFGGAGSGDGQFDFPMRIEFSDDGAAYILDVGNHRVQVFGQLGQIQ